jgi:hypothetical protein
MRKSPDEVVIAVIETSASEKPSFHWNAVYDKEQQLTTCQRLLYAVVI